MTISIETTPEIGGHTVNGLYTKFIIACMRPIPLPRLTIYMYVTMQNTIHLRTIVKQVTERNELNPEKVQDPAGV